MKNFTSPTKKSGLLLLALMLLSAASFGATYTASATGDWNSSATWAGGTVPPLYVTGDQIIIPTGVTVSLANNLTVNGALASVAVNGTLSSAAADTIILGTGAITGAGTLNAGTLILNTGASLAFTGTVAVNVLINLSAGLQAVAHTTINQALVLVSNLSVNINGTLTMATNSTIVITGGAISTAGGVLTLTNTYNVMYLTSTAHGGLELTGSGLNDVTVNVPSIDSVYLGGNTTLDGTLTLTSGTLSLNGHDLSIMGNIAASGSGVISSTSASSVNVSTAASPSGALTFSSNGNTVNNFTVNIGGSGGTLSLGSDATVNGTLTLTAGTLNVQSYALDIASGGSISGGSSTAYVIAMGNGYLGMYLTAGAAGFTTYPVGTSMHFAPVAVQLNGGSASQDVDVSVGNGIMAQGTTGADLSLSSPSVNVTYFIEPDNAAQANANLQLMWSTTMQVNGFNHDSAYISHYVGYWDQSTVMAATSANGMFSLQRNNVGSFSPFAVFGKNAFSGVGEISADSYFHIYPNPVADKLVIINYSKEPTLNADIIDISGQVVSSYKVNGDNSSISLQGLMHGNYFIKLYGDKVNAVKSFSKL